MIILLLPVVFSCRQLLKVCADHRKNGRLRKYHYSKIQNAGDCVTRTGVREIGFKFGSLPQDPGGITCMETCEIRSYIKAKKDIRASAVLL